MAKTKGKKNAASPSSFIPTYDVWADPFPAQRPTVRILFHGLMMFFFNHKNGCTVGLHNSTHRPISLPQHSQPHDLEIHVLTRMVGGPIGQLPLIIGDPKTGGPIDITVVNPDIIDGTYVFAKGTFSRTAASNDDRDWRWIMDFEGPDFYQRRLDKDVLKYTPLTINNGLFYTFHKTKSRFETQYNSSRVTDLSHIAMIIGANIYLKPGGSVSIMLGGVPLPPLVAIPGFTYDIVVRNDCRKRLAACDFEPHHLSDRTRRNDFYLYYDLFSPPLEQELDLYCYDIQEPQVLSKTARETDFFRAKSSPLWEILLTDPAPCAPTGSGGDPGTGGP